MAETRPATKPADTTETACVGGPPQKAVATIPDKKRFKHMDSRLAKRGKEAMGIDDIGDGASKRRRTVLRDSLFRELLWKTSER